jgi:hypothetical protein
MKIQFANIPATTQQTIIRAMRMQELQPAKDEGIKLGGVMLVSPEMVSLEIERREEINRKRYCSPLQYPNLCHA